MTDFVIREGTRVKELIQVVSEMSDAAKKRETRGLVECAREFGLERGMIVTKDIKKEETIEGTKIRFTPVWKWLLGSTPSPPLVYLDPSRDLVGLWLEVTGGILSIAPNNTIFGVTMGVTEDINWLKENEGGAGKVFLLIATRPKDGMSLRELKESYGADDWWPVKARIPQPVW